MAQNALTIITRVQAGKVAALESLLEKIGKDIAGNTYIPFAKITSLHFGCMVIIKDTRFPTYLVFESNHDGSDEDHIRSLIALAGNGLDAIYSLCENYPINGVKDAGKVTQYLLAARAACPAFYIACPGHEVQSIRNAIAVREEIETFLDAEDAAGNLRGLTAVQTYEKVSRFVQQTAAVKPLCSPETLDQQTCRAWRNLIVIILIALPIVILLLPLLLIFVICLRIHELRDDRLPPAAPLPIDPRLFEAEDIFIQNHLTTMVDVKPGAFRLKTLQFVLWLINLLAKAFFITGNLGGIPTIHFARWVLMDNNRRLLFFSNYDGSWASYLGDFVDKANYGLTAVWSNTPTFPSSKFLFWGGAQHIEPFKQWSREHNCYAAVWYSAYPEETVVNLLNDIQIRDTIGQPLTEEKALRFLQRF